MLNCPICNESLDRDNRTESGQIRCSTCLSLFSESELSEAIAKVNIAETLDLDLAESKGSLDATLDLGIASMAEAPQEIDELNLAPAVPFKSPLGDAEFTDFILENSAPKVEAVVDHAASKIGDIAETLDLDLVEAKGGLDATLDFGIASMTEAPQEIDELNLAPAVPFQSPLGDAEFSDFILENSAPKVEAVVDHAASKIGDVAETIDLDLAEAKGGLDATLDLGTASMAEAPQEIDELNLAPPVPFKSPLGDDEFSDFILENSAPKVEAVVDHAASKIGDVAETIDLDLVEAKGGLDATLDLSTASMAEAPQEIDELNLAPAVAFKSPLGDDEFTDFILENSTPKVEAVVDQEEAKGSLDATLDLGTASMAEAPQEIDELNLAPPVPFKSPLGDAEFSDFILENSAPKVEAVVDLEEAKGSLDATLDLGTASMAEASQEIDELNLAPPVPFKSPLGDDEFSDFILENSAPKVEAVVDQAGSKFGDLAETLDLDLAETEGSLDATLDLGTASATEASEDESNLAPAAPFKSSLGDDEFSNFILEDSIPKADAASKSTIAQAASNLDDVAESLDLIPDTGEKLDELDEFSTVVDVSDPKTNSQSGVVSPAVSLTGLDETLDLDEAAIDDDMDGPPKAAFIRDESFGSEVLPPRVEAHRNEQHSDLNATVRLEEQTIEIDEDFVNLEEVSIDSDEPEMAFEGEVDEVEPALSEIDEFPVESESQDSEADEVVEVVEVVETDDLPSEEPIERVMAYSPSRSHKRRPAPSPIKTVLGIMGGGVAAVAISIPILQLMGKWEPIRQQIFGGNQQIAKGTVEAQSLPSALTEERPPPDFGSTSADPVTTDNSVSEEPTAENGAANNAIEPPPQKEPLPVVTPVPLSPNALSPEAAKLVADANRSLAALKTSDDKENKRKFYLDGCALANVLSPGSQLSDEVSQYAKTIFADPAAPKVLATIQQQWWKLKTRPQPGLLSVGTLNREGTKLILPPFPDQIELPLESFEPLPPNKQVILFGRIRESSSGNVVEVTGIQLRN